MKTIPWLQAINKEPSQKVAGGNLGDSHPFTNP